ncbi:hypothetical protein L210DRAFT_3766069 [Boletus edulis BED1]|uniref:Uncharacterized protein n=1 Tax=Boletus edulis BED1 TaxID=1328754 RepID=A0AAD4G758_BOLED|nr:hypothetical protein L210DRAFT_3766069 [Boletus edulis BED1]
MMQRTSTRPSSATVHFKAGSSPTQPVYQSERNCSHPTSTMSSRARMLISRPTVSIRAQPLISHLHQAFFDPGRSSPTQPYQFERNCLCPTSTMSSRARMLISRPTVSIRAQPLVSHVHQAFSIPAARLPPPPLQAFFDPGRSSPSSTVSSRARSLIPTHPRPFERNRSSPTQPVYQFERNCSCPTSTMSS